MRLIALIFGIVMAALGGVIAYRALFIEPSAAVVITSTDVREVQNWWKAALGILMLLVGAALALMAARRPSR
ncbi:MAG TPA: hypothetical protein VEQ40_03380 [Pyrinomonadaceae bacterium]|nr:hypothetical protein [Pyrinomonadaceae bacterium]